MELKLTKTMSKNTKIIVGVVIAVLVIVGIWYGMSQKSNTETGPIKIGYVGPLSGDAAAYGETERNVTEMAVNEINAAGGIDGRNLEVIYEDGKCNGKDATSALQKLISVDSVSIVLGGACSAESLAMVPIATQNKVLLLSGFSSNPQLTGSSSFFFRNSPKDTDVAKLDAEVIAKKYKKVALISENTDYSLGVRTIMKGVFDGSGVSVVADELYNSSQSDFKTIFTKIKNSGADVLYLNPGTSAKMAGIMVKQVRELGMTLPIHGNFTLVGPDALEVGGKYMEGIVASDTSGLADKGKIMLQKYVEKFGKQPANEYLLGSSYDRPYIIAQAIRSVGLNPANIAKYLKNMSDFEGAVGKYHFDNNGDVVGVGFMSVTVKDGKEVPYSN